MGAPIHVVASVCIKFAIKPVARWFQAVQNLLFTDSVLLLDLKTLSVFFLCILPTKGGGGGTNPYPLIPNPYPTIVNSRQKTYPCPMDSSRLKKFKKLARMMNDQTTSYAHPMKSMYKIFDLMLTTEETDFLLHMGKSFYTRDELESHSGLPAEEFSSMLNGLIKKGIIWTELEEGVEEVFVLPPILPGWFELILTGGGETPRQYEFSKLLDDYFNEIKAWNFFPLRSLLNLFFRRDGSHRSVAVIVPKKKEKKAGKKKVVEVRKEIPAAPMTVYPKKNVRELIEKYGNEENIALVRCFCRQRKKMAGDSCEFKIPLESCIVVGRYSNHIAKYGFGKKITKREAHKVMDMVEKKGALHQVFYVKEDLGEPEIAICNCCWDCCEAFRLYHRGVVPLMIRSFYIAHIAEGDKCNGCGLCVKPCPVQAITIADKMAIINEPFCIGCGQCALKCTRDAVELEYSERDVFLPVLKKSQARIE